MEVVSKTYKCPNCGGSVTLDSNNCTYCRQPIYITTLSSIRELSDDMIKKYINNIDNDNELLIMTKGICYLKLKLYEKARECFNKCLELNIDNSEVYFLYAVSLLNGTKPFLSTHDIIDEVEKYLNNAISLENKGIYYYLMSYIKVDYYNRKHLKSEPDYLYYLTKANNNGVSLEDKKLLFEILSIEYQNIE